MILLFKMVVSDSGGCGHACANFLSVIISRRGSLFTKSRAVWSDDKLANIFTDESKAHNNAKS